MKRAGGHVIDRFHKGRRKGSNLPRGSSYLGVSRPPRRCTSLSPSHHVLDYDPPMTDYFDYQGMNSGHLEAGPGPNGFVRPLNFADRKSGTTPHTSRASNASGLTYATNGSAPVPDETQRSPAEPIMGMPSPVIPPNGLRLPGEEQYDDEEEDDEDPEYMMVDADMSMGSQFEGQNQPLPVEQEPPPKIHHNKPVPVKVQGGRKGFVGGFVSGLRRLPRILRNQRGQTVQRQPSHDTVLELPGFGEGSPNYDPFRAQPPAIPRHPVPTPHHVPSIPASHQVTSMHYSHYTHEDPSESPTSRDPRDFDDEELGHAHSESDEDSDHHSTHNLSTIAQSAHQSARYSTHHSTHHSTHNSTHDSDRGSNPSSHRSATPSRPQTALDGDTTLIQQNGSPEVVAAHPHRAPDYKSMAPGPSPSSSNSSIAANTNRIQKFVTDVYNLPWVATKVTVDFVPERDGRRYHGMDPDMKKISKPLQSWYPPLHKDLDLLAEAPQPESAPVMAHRRQDGHRRALTESSVTPTSGGVTQSITPSTTYSNPRRYSINSEPTPRHLRHTRDFRHAHRHRRRHRDHSRPHSPPIYPILASPQPLYLYQGPATPPIMPTPQPMLGSSPSSPRSRRGVASPAVPVYMISVPPPVYQPMTSFPYATPQATHTQPTHSQPATNPPTSG